MATDIEWVQGPNGERGETWNPVRGCKAVSPGCAKCYSEPMTARLEAMGQAGYAGLTKIGTGAKRRVWTGEFREVPDMLDRPLRWKRPRTIFVNSMSDLFGEGVSNEFIARVFGVMAASPRHTYQVLTKRATRLPLWFDWVIEQGEELKDAVGEKVPDESSAEASACVFMAGEELLGARPSIDAYNRTPWPLRNVHIGVSVEDRKHGLPRIDELRKIPSVLRWLSIEPLLEDLGEINLDGIGWVVVGGESGPGARPFDLAWARSIVAQCRAASVPCFVKQMGANPWDSGVELLMASRKGKDTDEWPPYLRLREMPKGV